MEFVARLRSDDVDRAMLLFQLRRLKATGEFVEPHNGGSDIQFRGEVPDEGLVGLLEALAKGPGALHADDRHFRLESGGHREANSIEEAEEHLGGPYTVPGTTRADWSFGGDRIDHLVQLLYFEADEMTPIDLRERTGYAIDQVMTALKTLAADGVVRKYRRDKPGGGNLEAYALARAAREKLERALAPAGEQAGEEDAAGDAASGAAAE